MSRFRYHSTRHDRNTNEKSCFLKSLECIFREFPFVSLNRLKSSDRVDIVEGRKKRYRSRDMRSPWLMTIGESSGFISLKCDGVDRTSSTESRIHSLQELLATIEKSDTRI